MNLLIARSARSVLLLQVPEGIDGKIAVLTVCTKRWSGGSAPAHCQRSCLKSSFWSTVLVVIVAELYRQQQMALYQDEICPDSRKHSVRNG